MRLVIFGLTVSSSWGNGHATLWRGLCRALAKTGHEVTFFERDVPYYAAHRDQAEPDGASLVLYERWDDVVDRAVDEASRADVAMVTSYCPDSEAASRVATGRRGLTSVFYDLDAPVTLHRLRAGLPVDYVPPGGLGAFDLVLSYAGGPALGELSERLGSRRVEALYGSVDPDVHRPAEPLGAFDGDLSYLGTFAEDRQAALDRLFLEPARRLPARRFVIGGSSYPPEFPWSENLYYVRHVPPDLHASFYSSSTFTLNVTRGPMVETGYCPSGRLFEAAACGSAMVSDRWSGLDRFFEPGREIVVADGPDDVLRALSMPREEAAAIGAAARDRALKDHTADRRALELLDILGRDRTPEACA